MIPAEHARQVQCRLHPRQTLLPPPVRVLHHENNMAEIYKKNPQSPLPEHQLHTVVALSSRNKIQIAVDPKARIPSV